MNHLIGSPQAVVLQIGDHQLTAKHALITGIHVHVGVNIECDISFVVKSEDWFSEWLNPTKTASVKHKCVADCSPAELLFAAKMKLEE